VREIPFNRPHVAGPTLSHVQQAIEGGLASGAFGARCDEWLARTTGADRALLAHSGTGALEAAAMLAGVGPGDEVIMPSFAFATIATAVVRQGGTPVFVDIRPDTLNVDPARVEAAVGPRTKAIVAVHYGGVGCDMEELLAIAADHGLVLIEDAAHSLLASYRDSQLGSIGQLGVLSFHHTKNVTSGEGGALLVNDPGLRERAEIVWEKGTDRTRFDRGEVDRYTWIDVGSSFAASEITAAFLWSQLEVAGELTERRVAIWDRYHAAFAEIERDGLARRPIVPADRSHNGHLYYLLLPARENRDAFIADLAGQGVASAFHYVPLHSAPAGRAYGRAADDLTHTDAASARLVRLPLWADLDGDSVERVIEASVAAVGRAAGARA
jgi:dTDP-4-amino-4,6-dideoxygalactose transaminase